MMEAEGNQACAPQVMLQVPCALGCHMEDPGYSDEKVGGMKAGISMKRPYQALRAGRMAGCCLELLDASVSLQLG